MNADSVIALDLGTTGVKAAVVMRSGKLAASAYRAYPTVTRGSEVEQDPRDWEAAALDAIRELAGSCTPSAIALTGQMQDLVLEGSVSSPAILYNDTRARDELGQLDEVYGIGRLSGEAGNAQDATNLAAKLLWVSKHEPARYRDAERLLLGAHDHVAYRLCGEAATDYTTASTTGLLVLETNSWNLELLRALGLRTDLLPSITGPGTAISALSAGAAKATGLPAGLPVIHGAGDAASTTIGSGAGEDGTLSINLGTSGWLAMTSSGSVVDTARGVYNLRHPDGRRLIVIGAPTTAAGNYDWFRESLMPGADRGAAFGRLNEEAAAARPGSILYLPYLAGERSPFKDPDVRASFIGLGRGTGRGDLARAVMEGVAFSLRAVRDAIGQVGAGGRTAATLVGGGARSPLWCSILASVLDSDIAVPASPDEAGVRGAAIIAGRALGWFDGYGAPGGFLPVTSSYQPRADWVSAYNAVYPVFLSAGEKLREISGLLVKNTDSTYRNS
jgi:xylulokinase